MSDPIVDGFGFEWEGLLTVLVQSKTFRHPIRAQVPFSWEGGDDMAAFKIYLSEALTQAEVCFGQLLEAKGMPT